MFFFVFKDSVVNVLAFASAKNFDDLMVFIADGCLNEAVMRIEFNTIVVARPFTFKFFLVVVFRQVERFSVFSHIFFFCVLRHFFVCDC